MRDKLPRMIRLNNIFLIGPMGAGKSTIGRAIASVLGYKFIDSDEEVERRAGAEIGWIFDIEGELGFRKREQKVIEELTHGTHIVLATGGGAVVTQENRQVLASRGTVIYLYTSLEQQYQRTRRDSRRPLLQTENVKLKIDELWGEREPLYRELADYSFNTDSLPVKVIAKQIVQHICQE
jgi:shikimate kinase